MALYKCVLIDWLIHVYISPSVTYAEGVLGLEILNDDKGLSEISQSHPRLTLKKHFNVKGIKAIYAKWQFGIFLRFFCV